MVESSNFTTPCVPKCGDYDHWSLLMENLLRSKEYWSVIESGIKEQKENESFSAAQQKALDEAKLEDLKAKNYLFQAIDKSILKTIPQKETAKQLWESMKVKYQGNARVKHAQLQRFRRIFETLEMKLESKDIDLLTVDELQSSLLVHEQKVREKRSEEQVLQVEHGTRYGRGRGRNNSQRGSSSYVRGRGRAKTFANRNAIICYRCQKQGHYQFECPNLERKQTMLSLMRKKSCS
ncbi:Zinc finger, CCHC-type [Sesbania bispinosa]|nr:Zinc finger, CCHC-type [Sesbania bispinosa]